MARPTGLKSIDLDELKETLAPKKKAAPEKPLKTRFPAPPQFGPLVYVDKEERCIVSGYFKYEQNEAGEYTGNKEWVKNPKGACHAPTCYRLLGKPVCSTHALREMNEMLIEQVCKLDISHINEGPCDHNTCNWSTEKVAPEFRHLLKNP